MELGTIHFSTNCVFWILTSHTSMLLPNFEIINYPAIYAPKERSQRIKFKFVFNTSLTPPLLHPYPKFIYRSHIAHGCEMSSLWEKSSDLYPLPTPLTTPPSPTLPNLIFRNNFSVKYVSVDRFHLHPNLCERRWKIFKKKMRLSPIFALISPAISDWKALRQLESCKRRLRFTPKLQLQLPSLISGL